MECVEGSLKSSFTGVSLTHHHPQPCDIPAVTGDDFFVDGLLDFSDDADFEEANTHVVADTNNDKSLVISPVNYKDTTTGFSLPDSDLCLPVDEVADLEWVSHFVDDSFSGGYSLPCPAWKSFGTKAEPEGLVTTGVKVKPTLTLTTPVVTKSRSKRARTGGRVWSLGSTALTDSSASSSCSSSYTSNPWLFLPDVYQTAESVLGKPPVKRRKKRTVAVPAAEPAVVPRRCSHCHVQKTPQWRAGPLGAKTLCNACGVRFKSGRLLPEYRPACSPTFSSEVHSNNHRKVLEMRQKKETAGVGLTSPVRSF